jgi:hypothetical protein
MLGGGNFGLTATRDLGRRTGGLSPLPLRVRSNPVNSNPAVQSAALEIGTARLWLSERRLESEFCDAVRIMSATGDGYAGAMEDSRSQAD